MKLPSRHFAIGLASLLVVWLCAQQPVFAFEVDGGSAADLDGDAEATDDELPQAFGAVPEDRGDWFSESIANDEDYYSAPDEYYTGYSPDTDYYGEPGNDDRHYDGSGIPGEDAVEEAGRETSGGQAEKSVFKRWRGAAD